MSKLTSGRNRPWLDRAIWAGCMLIAGVLGYVASEALNFSSDYRAALDREIAATQSETQQVHKSLVTLATVARGEAQISPDLVKKFDQDLVNLHQKAKTVSGLLPQTADAFKTYKEAMLGLSKSVSKLQGPTTARAFVESTSKWYVAKEKFDEKVEAARTTYRVVPSILEFKTAPE